MISSENFPTQLPGNPPTSEQPESSLPSYENKYDVPLSDSEFLLLPGHYYHAKDSALTWIRGNFAREVKVSGGIFLVVDISQIIAWMEENLKESPLEKVRLYLVMILTLLLPVQDGERVAANVRLELLQKIIDVLQPVQVMERNHMVERTLRALEQEVRQFIPPTFFLNNIQEEMLVSVDGGLGQIEEGEFDLFINRVKAGELETKINEYEQSFHQEMLLIGRKLEFYSQRFRLATKVVDSLTRQKAWEESGEILELRMELAEAIEVVAAQLPEPEKLLAFYDQVTAGLTLFQELLQKIVMNQEESNDYHTVHQSLLEVRQKIKTAMI